MSPIPDPEDNNDAPHISITLLEQHALEALRTLARATTSTLLSHAPALANAQHYTRTLRAIGSALGDGQGLSWETLLGHARGELRDRIAQQLAPDLIVYTTILDLVLTLWRSPADLRFAPPGLGRQFIALAVSLEHLLVLDSPPEPPGSPTFPEGPLSDRERLLLEVTRVLAALELREQLPQGQRVTVTELHRLNQAVRHRLTQEVPDRGTSLDEVLDRAGAELSQLRDEDDATGINTLRDCLAAALIAPVDSDEALIEDGALLLALAEAAHALAQGHQRQT